MEHENYTIIIANNKRSLRGNADSVLGADGLYRFDESDYADAVTPVVAAAPVVRVFAEDLDVAQVKTLAGINALIEQMLRGESVQAAKIKSVLSQLQFANYIASLTEIRDNVEVLYGDGMPKELKAYNVRLNAADMMDSSYERMAGSRKKYKVGQVTKVANKAESLYETAAEVLEEIFSVETGEKLHRLHTWMDRDVVFGNDGNIGIDRVDIPRVKGSKSHEARDFELPKLSKRLKQKICMLAALNDAACDIAFTPLPPASALTVAQTQLLSTKLRQLMRH